MKSTLIEIVLIGRLSVEDNSFRLRDYLDQNFFERELALLVALQGKSIWKGGGGGAAAGGVHWKDATSSR